MIPKHSYECVGTIWSRMLVLWLCALGETRHKGTLKISCGESYVLNLRDITSRNMSTFSQWRSKKDFRMVITEGGVELSLWSNSVNFPKQGLPLERESLYWTVMSAGAKAFARSFLSCLGGKVELYHWGNIVKVTAQRHRLTESLRLNHIPSPTPTFYHQTDRVLE